jgi:hypothetical protein
MKCKEIAMMMPDLSDYITQKELLSCSNLGVYLQSCITISAHQIALRNRLPIQKTLNIIP